MYHAHWGLSESPFQSRLDPTGFYQSPTHEEALARLHFLVEQRRRLGLLMGSAGSGKSFVLEVFAGHLRRAGRPTAKLSLAGLEATEFLALTATGLGLNPDRDLSVASLWRLLSDRITELRYQRMATILLLDDADLASRAVLAQLLRLAKLEPGPDSRLTLVLAGQHADMGRLGESLLDLADLRIDLEPWDASETARYVRASLARAGCASPVFNDGAVTRLFELSQGIPRRVSQLADLALAAGAGRQLEAIDAGTVESACRELGMVEVNAEG